MSVEDSGVDKWRAAFRALGDRARSGPECPPPERLWSAVAGELTPEQRREVIDHTARCAACAEDWRLALEIHPEPAASPASGPRLSRAWPASAVTPLAAAAALLLASVAGITLLRGPSRVPSPGYRDAGPASLRSLLPDEPLPRSDFRLRWTAAPAGARYEVRVTTEALEAVASAHELEDASFLVPESALHALPSGARLLWQVQARLPDGGRRDSPTFVTMLR